MLPVMVNGCEFRTVEVAGKMVTVCQVDVGQEHVILFHRDDTGAPFKRFDRINDWLNPRGERLVFAMNAGMYHGDFSPVGLFVANGKELAPLNLADGYGNFFMKPNGVFAITDKGARIIESSEYSKLREREKVLLATQSGPLLLRGGKIHPAFNAESKSRLRRNGVGLPSGGIAIFAISDEPVTFFEFATLFRDKLHCPDALFLDGTVSSLYAAPLKRNDFRMELGPMIGVVEKVMSP
ncbi:MAG: phosphodiester glycosidase family protein [Verrucomicrobiaceae bacterium]|nr:phosphodiester glycosidase family protein [Verrucomicrobiaceae bacterium]